MVGGLGWVVDSGVWSGVGVGWRLGNEVSGGWWGVVGSGGGGGGISAGTTHCFFQIYIGTDLL